jgi:hypothetical protein
MTSLFMLGFCLGMIAGILSVLVGYLAVETTR